MEKISANTGWLWVRQGFSLFRKQPAELSTLFISYMFLMLVIGIVPVVGQLLPLVLVPAFSMAFMQACVNIEGGKRVYPSLLLAGFRSPAFGRLLQLGTLYMLAAVVAVGSSSLVDGGVFWQVMSGQADLDPKTIQESNMALAILFAAAVYVPAAMGFWYAAPLTVWQNMGVGKAIFYSFFAVRRASLAFLMYGLAWVAIGVVFPAVISIVIAAIIGKTIAAMMVMLPLSIVLTVVMYCSFYATYTSVFGQQAAAPQA
jgi:hypothetical protein